VYAEDELTGVVDQGSATSFAWVHGDHLGTPYAVTSTPAAAGASVVWRATYAPFGLATPSEDPDGDSHVFRLDSRLPGQIYDPVLAGHFALARTFDPATGRYAEAETPGRAAELNAFGFSANNPLGGAGVGPQVAGLIPNTSCEGHPGCLVDEVPIRPEVPMPPIVMPFNVVPDSGETEEPEPTPEERERRNKECVEQFDKDIEWCEKNACDGDQMFACRERARDNLIRCNNFQPRLPRAPWKQQ
jgi:RHS repeat-associated protein